MIQSKIQWKLNIERKSNLRKWYKCCSVNLLKAAVLQVKMGGWLPTSLKETVLEEWFVEIHSKRNFSSPSTVCEICFIKKHFINQEQHRLKHYCSNLKINRWGFAINFSNSLHICQSFKSRKPVFQTPNGIHS